jgi:hypothetical protein
LKIILSEEEKETRSTATQVLDKVREECETTMLTMRRQDKKHDDEEQQEEYGC